MIGQYVTVFGDVISHVNISVVKSDDGGEYECTARSRAGSMSHTGRLNIYGKATLYYAQVKLKVISLIGIFIRDALYKTHVVHFGSCW